MTLPHGDPLAVELTLAIHGGDLDALRRLASWMTVDPRPPEPAWTRTFWPGCEWARSTRACQAASDTAGSEHPGREVESGRGECPTRDSRTLP